jgi:LydA holin phage, holin superfamily III
VSDPTKDPATFNLIQYALFTAFATLGGLVSFAQKVRAGKSKWVNLMELIGELVASGFAGIIVLLICDYMRFDVKLTGAMVGISGWMGTRCLYLLESFLAEKFGIKEVPVAARPYNPEDDLKKLRPASRHDADPSPMTAAQRARRAKQAPDTIAGA